MSERRRCLGILGIHEGATEDEIKKAYKKLALQYHPDKNASEDAKAKFQEIGYAYKYLTEGPSAFGTTDPHDVREEFLRRMFEEMFFAQFHPFTFFCENSDDDDYYVYQDDSDENTYYQSGGPNNVYDHTRRAYQRTYPQQTPAHQNYPHVSKKQMRKREKRQRQKERAKERKEQGKKEAKNVYTDDINPDPKKNENKTATTIKDDIGKESESNTDIGNSRPDTPVLNKQSQKLSKKQMKKKMESEQRKRDREMQEIAAELKKKHERQLEKQKEKERIAALKKEEEKENEINFNHFFDTGKKSRKARQREKKRQESGAASRQGDNSGSYEQSEGPTQHINSHTNRTSYKNKTGGSMSKTGEQKKTATRKPTMPSNRFDILDDIDDDITRPLSRTSISSSDSVDNSQPDSEHHVASTGKTATYGKLNNPSFQDTNVNPKYSTYILNHKSGEKDNDSYVGNGNDINLDKNSGLDEFDVEGREFVKDWSVYQSDEETVNDDMTFTEGWSQSENNQNRSHNGYGTNYTSDKYGNGNNDWKQVRGRGTCQPQSNQRREFIPRTRGYHGPPYNGSFYSGPQQPSYHRGAAPFTRDGEGRYFHRPPNFRGGYQQMPVFRGRNDGHSGPRYNPPVRMPAYGYGQPYNSSVPFTGFSYGKEGNETNDIKMNNYMQENSEKQFNSKKSFNNSARNETGVMSGFQPNVVRSSSTTSGTGKRVSSSQFMSWQNIEYSNTNGNFSRNTFCDLENNQASSAGSLDSIDDDVVNCDTNQAKGNENAMEAKSSVPGENSFSYAGVDLGPSEYLSKDNLGVPSGMFSDSIKNYYK